MNLLKKIKKSIRDFVQAPELYDQKKVLDELTELKWQAEKDMGLSEDMNESCLYYGKMLAYEISCKIVKEGGIK